MPKKKIIAIVGRPNVGKSTLFNRLLGKNKSIVENFPGVTRDRLYADARYNDTEYILTDTGGLLPGAESDVTSRRPRDGRNRRTGGRRRYIPHGRDEKVFPRSTARYIRICSRKGNRSIP